MNYALFTDTNTDMSPEKAQEFGYNLISMPYRINDKDIFPYVDFNEYDYRTFYDTLRNGVIPKTFSLSPQNYVDYFEPFFKDGKDILYVHFSFAMSGTFNALKLAEDMLKEKYPERTVYTLDTKMITVGAYNIVLEVGELYKQGKSIKEILEWGKTEIDKFAFYFFADDLKFFAKSGRVKGFKYFIGNILKIKPLIHVDEKGVMVNIASIKGTIATVNKIVEIVDILQDDIYNHKVVIGHSNADGIAEILGKKLQERFDGKLDIEYVITNPTIGGHCGPDGVGVCFHAKSRTTT